MLKELKGMEYTLEILRALHLNPGQHDSKHISELIEQDGRIKPSPTYVAKILPRMRKAGLLRSSELGYVLAAQVDEITVDTILDICPMPDESSPLHQFCLELKGAVSLTTIDEFYEFNRPDDSD
jgi:DNA-binding IscR family transcriptional regulator